MDIDYGEIGGRLAASFGAGAHLVFWEDAQSEYRDAIGGVALDGAELIDATNHELATKRIVLRQRRDERFVVYRAGGAPDPAEDLLLDVKLASKPFACTVEGLWAEECGIPAGLAEVVSEHAAFFKSRERREALAATALPKADARSLRFAMVATLMKSRDSQPRDAARTMAKRALTEWARGDGRSLRALEDAGLTQALWSALREHVGYAVRDPEQPNVGDFAFRLLEGRCGALVDDAGKANEAESVRILDDLAHGRTRDVFDRIVSEYGDSVAALIPDDAKAPELLEGIDAIPQIDEWMLTHLANAVMQGDADASRAKRAWATRRYGLFHERYAYHYQLVIALCEFQGEVRAYRKECGSGIDLPAVLERYCASWHLVDRRYREIFLNYGLMPPGAFKQRLEGTVKRAQADYDEFLVDLTDRWQSHLLDEGTWPPGSLASQDGFFYECVEGELPRAERGRRIGVVISDALRYEVGRDLAGRLSASKAKALEGRSSVSCDYRLGMIPSYTQLGMAALLPDGPLEIDPATMRVTKDGLPTEGTSNRARIVADRIPGSVVLKAGDVLEGAKLDLADAPVAVVYHNVIDKVGDERETEGKVFEAVEQACGEVERLVVKLVQAGCGKVLVTSDHGFLFQFQSPESYAYVDIEGLSQLKSDEGAGLSHTRRFVVGPAIPRSDSLIEYAAVDLSLEGDYRVAIPRGITRLRLRGSGARFVHGGASLQENVIPVITVKASKDSPGSHPTPVEGYATGRCVITGPDVSVIVYQAQRIGEFVAPQTARVGAYAADGTLLSSVEKSVELCSGSADIEQRKTTVTLPLVDEIDGYSSVFVRISTRIGETNAFETAWEREYAVNRAFGRDF